MIRKTCAIFCTVAALTTFAAFTWGGEQTPAGKPAAETAPASGKGCSNCAKADKADHRCTCGCCCKCEGGAAGNQAGCMKDGKGAAKGGCAKMGGKGEAPAKP